jgi:hypothetical protein
MFVQPRPLWQLLLAVRSDSKTPLTCAECFSILDYLAELRVEAGHQRVLRAVHRHLSNCPKCSQLVDSRLEELDNFSYA